MRKLYMTLSVLTALVSIYFLLANIKTLIDRKETLKSLQTPTMLLYELSEEQKIKNFFYENLGNGIVFHKLWTIFKCESGWNQNLTHTNYHKSGRCYPTSTDWGIAMINDCYWDEDAKAMNLDYKNNVYDNLLMAKYIYDVGGITQWVCYNNGYK
jgi:hypothetical protein